MKVKEIDFIGRRRPAGIKPIHNLSNLGWSGPVELPIPIRFNGVTCTHCVVSSYGAIRFTQASNPNGKWSFWNTDKALPEDISETEKGWMIIPWGELVKVIGCGVSVCLYEQNGNVIFDYEIKSSYDKDKKYLFRVEFPVREPDIVRCFYYHCVSGYNTFIGIAKEPDNVISWPLKENTPYMKKALEFDTSASSGPEPPVNPAGRPTDPPRDGYEWVVFHTPFGDQWKQQKITSETRPPATPDLVDPPHQVDAWRTVLETATYRVQELVNE